VLVARTRVEEEAHDLGSIGAVSGNVDERFRKGKARSELISMFANFIDGTTGPKPRPDGVDVAVERSLGNP